MRLTPTHEDYAGNLLYFLWPIEPTSSSHAMNLKHIAARLGRIRFNRPESFANDANRETFRTDNNDEQVENK